MKTMHGVASVWLSIQALTFAAPMFDPAIDDPTREWCYAAQSTTVIGLPFVPEPVQVTFDGVIYTRHAELAFFFGWPLKPVNSHPITGKHRQRKTQQ